MESKKKSKDIVKQSAKRHEPCVLKFCSGCKYAILLSHKESRALQASEKVITSEDWSGKTCYYFCGLGFDSIDEGVESNGKQEKTKS